MEVCKHCGEGHPLKRVAIAVEVVGCVLIPCGILYEMSSGADLGYGIISAGSVLIAVGGLLWSKILR